MKKYFFIVLLLVPFLFYSHAIAAPYTTTLEFEGTAWYQSEVDVPPYGEAYINYLIDENLPDLDTVCDWTADIEVWTNGEMITDGGIIPLDFSGAITFDLGRFAFNDILDQYSYLINFVCGQPSEGWIPGLENFLSYRLEGDRVAGTAYFALWVPIIQGVDDLDVQFGLNLKLNANPVPEPATMFLFGFGLIGLAGFSRRKFVAN